MHEYVQDDLLILEFLQIEIAAFFVGGFFTLSDPLHDLLLINKLVVLNNLLHLGKLCVVTRHVGCQDKLNGSFTEVNVLLLIQLVQKLKLLFVQNPK